MSLPDEKIRSLVSTRKFLFELIGARRPKQIDSAVRQCVFDLLKHYPTEHCIKEMAAHQRKVAKGRKGSQKATGKSPKGKKKLPFGPDYYFICQICAEFEGGKFPLGHVCTVSHGECEYCGREGTIIPWVDFDWPDVDTKNLRD